MIHVGNKIVVVGVSATGKSTFSKKLGSVIQLPVVFVDSIMWKPGWNYIGDELTAAQLNEISKNEKWIIEGYIVKGAREFIFDRADTILYLDYSSLVSSWRYIQRWWKHQKDPRPELEGSPEKFSFKFLKLVWTKGEMISLKKILSQTKNQNKTIVFKSPRQARNFLQQI